jgi:dienelactone hydrolase
MFQLLILCLVSQAPASTANVDRSLADWQSRRVRTLDGMQKVMGPLPAKTKEPFALGVESVEQLEKVVRKKVEFVPEIGDRLTAYLIVPKKVEGKRPAMLCLHQTTKIGKGEPAGLGGKPNLRYALELAERGYVALAPDYPGYGDYQFDPYQHGYQSATMKGIVNHRRCVDLLQSLVEVDPDRIGVIGHSLGGHNALFVAAFDERLKVIVTSCGFTSFPKYYGGNLKGWTHKGYMPRIASEFGNDPKSMPFDFPELLASLAPRAVFINAPLHDDNFEVSGVRDCVRLATPAFDLFKAKERLVAEHPDCGHDFPPVVRKRAYEFIDKNLSSARTSSPFAPRKDSNAPLNERGQALRITP